MPTLVNIAPARRVEKSDIRDLPFSFIIGAPARHAINEYHNRGSISTPLAINPASTLARETPRHANPLKIQLFDTFSTHFYQLFLITCPDFRFVADHAGPASSGLALNRPIRSRISAKSALDTATSAIWNTTYRECLTTLVPILTSFSRKVVSDQCFTLGTASIGFRLLIFWLRVTNYLGNLG
jgi:hypothetical protein